jgi:predicted NBD/HSP70 family sugar kinase
MESSYVRHRNPIELRDPSLQRVFAAILEAKNGLSRAQIEQKTGLQPQAVKNAVRTLVERRFIDVDPYNSINLPREEPVSIVQSRFCVIGLKILPSEVLGVVTDLRCNLLPIGADGAELTAIKQLQGGRHEPEYVVRALIELVQELVEQIPEGYSVLGTGVELGGHISDNVVIFSPNLQWNNVPLGDMLTEALSTKLKPEYRERFAPTELQVVIENDANVLAVVAQWFGAGSGRTSFALILVGDGIGCGIVINNELVHGINGAAGEIGHLVIAPESRSLICRCGKRGCLEAIATIPTILEAVVRAKKAYDQEPPETMADVVKLAEQKDDLTMEAFEFAGDALARAISYLLNLVNLEAVILETYEPKVTQLLVPTVSKRLPLYCFSTVQRDCALPLNPVAPERGAKGAATVMVIRLLGQGLPADTPVTEAS